VVSASRPIRLVARADGGARTVSAVEDADRPQLVLIQGYKPELAPIVAAYGEVEVFIRPATPVPVPLPQWPRLSKEQQAKRRKWLDRHTTRFGFVNAELPREPVPPVSRMSDRMLRPAPDAAEQADERAAAGTCCHCGGACLTGNLENFQKPDGRWSHLDCELAQP
jgi:hypothetical protein